MLYFVDFFRLSTAYMTILTFSIWEDQVLIFFGVSCKIRKMSDFSVAPWLRSSYPMLFLLLTDVNILFCLPLASDRVDWGELISVFDKTCVVISQTLHFFVIMPWWRWRCLRGIVWFLNLFLMFRSKLGETFSFCGQPTIFSFFFALRKA
jgi:hypothetical protein